MLADLLIADFPFPLALRTRTRVLAAQLWSCLEGMALAQILDADPKYIQDDEVGVRLIALPTLDADKDVTDIAIRPSAEYDMDMFTI